MIIDFHTHIFPDKIASRTVDQLEHSANIKAKSNGTIHGLINSMEDSGIDYSVVLPVITNPTQFHTVNTSAAKLNDDYKGKIISFGGIHPRNEDYKEGLRTIKKLGLRGIKLHPDYQGVFFDDIQYIKIVDYATELGLIISVHAGFDIGIGQPIHCTPTRVLNVLKEVTPDRLVLAHMGGFKLWDQVEELLVGKNIYFDTSYSLGFMDEQQILRIVRQHGVNKILFGTDNPWGSQKDMLTQFCSLHFSEEEKLQILGINASNLLFQN